MAFPSAIFDTIDVLTTWPSDFVPIVVDRLKDSPLLLFMPIAHQPE